MYCYKNSIYILLYREQDIEWSVYILSITNEGVLFMMIGLKTCLHQLIIIYEVYV